MEKIMLTATALTFAVAWAGVVGAQDKADKTAPTAMAQIQAKEFPGLIGMAGFSDTLINNHLKLYQGYVKNTNALLDELSALVADKKDRSPQYAELKRRLGWEFNGMLLHEYYFENLSGKDALDPESPLAKEMSRAFGSVDNWKQDFISTGMMRGIGWVVLYREPKTGRLVNSWVNEHDAGNLAGASPILVMDVFEHAYMIDYQLDKAKYIEAFFKNINWKAAQDRFGKS